MQPQHRSDGDAAKKHAKTGPSPFDPPRLTTLAGRNFVRACLGALVLCALALRETQEQTHRLDLPSLPETPGKCGLHLKEAEEADCPEILPHAILPHSVRSAPKSAGVAAGNGSWKRAPGNPSEPEAQSGAILILAEEHHRHKRGQQEQRAGSAVVVA